MFAIYRVLFHTTFATFCWGLQINKLPEKQIIFMINSSWIQVLIDLFYCLQSKLHLSLNVPQSHLILIILFEGSQLKIDERSQKNLWYQTFGQREYRLWSLRSGQQQVHFIHWRYLHTLTGTCLQNIFLQCSDSCCGHRGISVSRHQQLFVVEKCLVTI